MSNKGKQINVAQIERDEEMKNARAFRNSIRGKFIISQALTIAIKHLKKLEKRKDMYPKYGEHAQPSNRADMEYLKRQLYPIYDVVPRSREALHEWGIVKERKSDEEPTTADKYNKEYVDEMNEAIKETPEYKLGKKIFGGDTGTDADYYNENNEEYIK
jgi:hypothetical protein